MDAQVAVTERQDVTFASASERCAGWWWPPPRPGAPCVVLAHGFSATKEAMLDVYAERFVAEGCAALAFDYRHFGASTGEPRELLHIERQLEDWHAAVAYARAQDGVDPDRVIAWGTSFSGGHVMAVAADDERLAAAIAQVPHTSGPATVRALGWPNAFAGLAIGWLDRAGARLGLPPIYLPPESSPMRRGVRALYPADHEPRSQVAARVFTRLRRYSPGRRAAHISCPLLVLIAEHDAITPPAPALTAAQVAPRGRAITYPVEHFEIYLGESRERSLGDQVAFVREVLA